MIQRTETDGNKMPGKRIDESTKEKVINAETLETLHVFTNEASIVLDNALLFRQLAQKNINERLQTFFSSKAGLNVENEDHYYKVTLTFPYQTEQHEDTDR